MRGVLISQVWCDLGSCFNRYGDGDASPQQKLSMLIVKIKFLGILDNASDEKASDEIASDDIAKLGNLGKHVKKCKSKIRKFPNFRPGLTSSTY